MRELMSKLSVTELQLKAAEEDRDTLRADLENSDAGRDVLIKKAWETRDAAVKRKNNTEIELARTRIDVMQVKPLPYSYSAVDSRAPGEQPADGGHPAEGGVEPAARPVAAGHAGAPGGADEQENGKSPFPPLIMTLRVCRSSRSRVKCKAAAVVEQETATPVRARATKGSAANYSPSSSCPAPPDLRRKTRRRSWSP